jgi:hypothetical protein
MSYVGTGYLTLWVLSQQPSKSWLSEHEFALSAAWACVICRFFLLE